MRPPVERSEGDVLRYSLHGFQSAKRMLVLFNSQLQIQRITGSYKLCLLFCSFRFAQLIVHYLYWKVSVYFFFSQPLNMPPLNSDTITK